MPVELRVRPTKEEIAQLPPFVGLSLDRIHVVSTTSEFEAAHAAIRTERFIGFDTESKPTFRKDEVKKKNFELDPISGEELEAIVKEVMT